MSSSVRIRPNENHHLPALTYASPPPSRTNTTEAGPSYESYTSQPASGSLQPPRPSRSRHFRPWSFSVRGSRSDTEGNRSKPSSGPPGTPNGSSGQPADGGTEAEGVLKSYERLQVADQPPPDPQRPRLSSPHRSSGKGRWSDSDEEDHEPDAYSWVDPSVAGSEHLRRTVSGHRVPWLQTLISSPCPGDSPTPNRPARSAQHQERSERHRGSPSAYRHLPHK